MPVTVKSGAGLPTSILGVSSAEATDVAMIDVIMVRQITADKNFALDPVAWNAEKRGMLEPPSRSAVAPKKMRASCAHDLK